MFVHRFKPVATGNGEERSGVANVGKIDFNVTNMLVKKIVDKIDVCLISY